ncbi:MAG: tRNA pseudouridine(38-40) synthase TruA [Kiritimatiellae bacterium]|nr:tRNA pseudouridine(38-40) synthase TruA [Kiritimatiellia bacterium]
MSPVPAKGPTPRTRPPRGGQRYRLTIAYDGTDLYGWQTQPGKSTVQGALEAALQQLTGESPRVHSSGRTDTGVHARAQVAHLDLARPWEPWRLQKGLNALLADDIRVTELRRARPTFHARYDARGKEYRYTIWNAPVMSPLHRRQAVHIRTPLAVDAMRKAAAMLVGTHDFAAFSANPHREIEGTVRTLWRLAVRRQGALVTIHAVGDGFLYRMVRSLAGHLLRVGLGAVPAAETATLLASKTRTARVETAPAHGLCLWQIFYGAIPGLPKPPPA